MRVEFYDGWPLRYAHVIVPGLIAEHVTAGGMVCVWAEDDPAQVNGIELDGLWARLDEWATKAIGGFSHEDRALDAYASFVNKTIEFAELDLPTLVGTAGHGYRRRTYAKKRDGALLVGSDPEGHSLSGALYVLHHLDRPPRDLDEVRAALTRRQREDLDRNLARRDSVKIHEESGGLDHVTVVWPRYDRALDALVLGFSGTGDSLVARAHPTSPTDEASRLRRAGPDANLVTTKRVLVAGVGAIGSHVATSLANSGIRTLALSDSDRVKTANLVRFAGNGYDVGYAKTIAVAARIHQTAPWCKIEHRDALPYDPRLLANEIRGFDLIVDCTGIFSISAALSAVCAEHSVALLTGALYHQGAILRVRRQAPGDAPIAARPSSPHYVPLPSDQTDGRSFGFLELGCTAPIHNAPPSAVIRAAADIVRTTMDFLAGRNLEADEQITVLAPLTMPPFDQMGTIAPAPTTDPACDTQTEVGDEPA